jgi:hypothetical protein
MALKLTIGEFIDVPVKGSVKDGGRDISFAFTLQARRIPIEAYREALGEGSDLTVREFLAGHLTGWRDQRLVVDDTEQPAPFSADALGMLLSVVGMEQTVLGAYLRALQVSDSGAERGKT